MYNGVGRCRPISPLAYRFVEKVIIMDTKSLDKQGKAHLQVFQNVMFAAKVSIIAIIATLVIMAATLI
jgi:hypothetical protein